MGELVNYNVTFLTPEENQVIIDATATAPTIDNFNYTINNSGTSVTINVQFIPQIADTGFHVVTFTAQDNGADSLISTVTIVLAVYYTPDPPPTIEGNAEACEGVGSVISASPGYENYYWSNGFNGPTILVGPGTYYCLATSGNCRLASNFITVTEIPNPEPDITGPLFSCGGLPVTLGVNNAFDAYQWSNGSTDPNITVGTGQYVVTVTDTNGCVGTATPVNVLTANDPAAFFQSSDASTVFPGTTVTYTDQSSVQGSTITSYAWAINGEPAGNSTTLVSPWDTPGTYVVTLTVTSADGCTNTYSYTQIVIPTEIEIPNVFSPNGDNQNDALVFPGVEYYPNTSLRVFNRWGQAIYESTNYKNNWRAPDVAEGTYFFVLKLANGKDYSGHVTLLR
jgi:gliding motility-associated-like protein